MCERKQKVNEKCKLIKINRAKCLWPKSLFKIIKYKINVNKLGG